MSDDFPVIKNVLFSTFDPKHPGYPALTTLLFAVCDNDDEKFDEATRIVELFIEKALNYVHT